LKVITIQNGFDKTLSYIGLVITCVNSTVIKTIFSFHYHVPTTYCTCITKFSL